MSINSFHCKLVFSDKMNSRNMILSGALVALVMLVTTNVFFSSSALATPVGSGFNQSTALTAYIIKKAALICDQGASAPPSQSPPEIGGCIDVKNPDSGIGGNMTDFRYNEYLFTGEQLAELVVARDLNGAEFLASTANLLVDGASKVTCDEIDYHYAADLASGSATWFGHNVKELLEHMPPQQGVADDPGFDPVFDVMYNCILTVSPSMIGNPSSVAVQVSEVSGSTAQTVVQKWYFNPAISISVSFDSGSSIEFPPAMAGQTVFSTNTLMIKNTAAGGVDLAVYLVGNDLRDTSGIGMCPISNILDINDMRYRCKVGTYMSEEWTRLSHLKEANKCHDLSARKCLVEDGWDHNNDLLPDAAKAETSILYNGHTAECWFKLKVPVPCIGTFSAANAVEILVRAI
jgi:hypothetical protein